LQIIAMLERTAVQTHYLFQRTVELNGGLGAGTHVQPIHILCDDARHNASYF